MLRIAQEALTFDDVLLVPAHSTVLPHTASLQTRLTRKVNLNIPMVSASMDTVTEARLAIALAQEGGIGFVHKNMTPEEQAKHVREVKKYESGVVSDPVTVSATDNLGNVQALSKKMGYSGFPVTDADNNLIGIITGRDMRFENRLDLSFSKGGEFMFPEFRFEKTYFWFVAFFSCNFSPASYSFLNSFAIFSARWIRF